MINFFGVTVFLRYQLLGLCSFHWYFKNGKKKSLLFQNILAFAMSMRGKPRRNSG